MLVGMPTAAAGISALPLPVLERDGSVVRHGLPGREQRAILPATRSIQTHHVDLQERLLELVMKRQELGEELAGLYERYERELKRGPRRPIEVLEEAA